MPDLDEQIREFIDSGATPVTAAEVIAAHESAPSTPSAGPRYRHPRRIRSYAIGATAIATAICVLIVVLVVGVSSSKPTLVAPTRPAGVPAPWQKVTFGGLAMYAPGNWPTNNEETWEDCGTAWQPLFRASSVVLDTGAGPSEPPASCPAITSRSSIPPVYGVVIDPGQYGPLKDVMPIDPGFAPGVTGFDTCLLINGLSVCATSVSFGGILVVAVHIPRITRPVAVEIGLAGGGKVAHTILYSMRRSAPTSSTTTSGTVRPCSDGVLAVTFGKPADQATLMGGSIIVSIEVVNTGRSACSVIGTPRYFGRTASGTLVPLPHSVLTSADGTAPHALPVVLTSTHRSTHNHGYVTFLFAKGNSDQCLDPGTLMVEMPGQTKPAVVPGGLQTCSVSSTFVRPVSSTDNLAGLIGP